MSSGLFINGARPASKKAVKEAIANGVDIVVEGTSMFGGDFTGHLIDAPNGRIDFVGPDPYTSRKFYGSLVVTDATVTVK